MVKRISRAVFFIKQASRKGDKNRDRHVSKIVVGRNVEQVDKRKPDSGIFIPKMIRDDKDHREYAQDIEFLNPFFHINKDTKRNPATFIAGFLKAISF